MAPDSQAEDARSHNRSDPRLDSVNRLPTQHEVDDYEREATELQEHVDSRSAGVDEAVARRSHLVKGSKDRQSRWSRPITSFWKHYIALAVPHDECRDHLANERTFLAYLRTALALSTAGVTIAQLLRLQEESTTNNVPGYYALGRPLGALAQIVAIFMTLVAAHRYWRQQMSMARGKALAGGWEIYAIMGFFLLLLTGTFVLLLVFDIEIAA